MLVAYHNRDSIKVDILAQLAAHREADALIQDYGYWKGGRGCAVGCTLHSGNHMEYEARFGIPVELAHLEDVVFEGLPVGLATKWPERFMGAVRPGADLSRVHWHLLHWILTTPDVNPGIEHPLALDVVKRCADVVAELAAGKAVDLKTARDAQRAAHVVANAMWSAQGAMWSVAKSVEAAAWCARSALLGARSAARSVEIAVCCAARSAGGQMGETGAAWAKIGDKLIELVEAAPDAGTVASK